MDFNLKVKGLTPQDVFNSLYAIPVKLQFCHHNTTSYAAHKALDFAYDELNGLKDDIIERLIGYGIPRFKTLSVGTVSGNPDTLAPQIAKEIMDFAEKLEEWAESNDYCDIENLAQEYSGIGAKLNYLLTLK